MKNKIQTAILLLSALLASGIFWILFEVQHLLVIEDQVYYWIYGSFKIFTLLAIVLVWIYSLKKREPSNTYILVYTTVVLQLIPLFVRLLAMGIPSTFEVFLFTLITVLSIIGFISLWIMIDRSNEKIAKVLPTLKGNEIPLQDDNDFYDENGNFVGVRKKGDKNE